MTDILTIFIIVMAFVALSLIVIAVYEFISGIIEQHRERNEIERQRNEQGRVVYYVSQMPPADTATTVAPAPAPVAPAEPAPAPAPAEPAPVEPAPVVEETAPAVEEPAPVVEETAPVVEETAPAVEENSGEETVAFEVKSQRKTLKEEYDALTDEKKAFYDAIVNEAKTFEKARCKESSYAFTIMQGQDTVGKIKFSKGEIMLDCTIVNPALKAYGKESGSKIKNKPIRFKIVDEHSYNDAIYTLRLANQTAFEARQKKAKAE